MPAYDARIGQAFPGMIANSRPADGVSGMCEDAGGVGFGIALFQGTKDNTFTKTPSAKFRGITVSDPTLVKTAVSGVIDTFRQGENLTAKRGGVVWVINGAAVVVKGDPVYVTPAGAYTNVSAGNTRLGNCLFDSSAAAAALVKIEINV